MIDELKAWGLVPPAVVADAGYGEITAFRQGLTDRGIPHVLAVKASTSAHPAGAVPEPVPYSGRGPRCADRYRENPSSLRELALAAGRKHLHQATWRHGTKTGPGNRTTAMKSRFLALRIRPANRDIPLNKDGSLPEAWMLAEWPAHEPAPTDYWLSDLPADTPLKTLVRLAKNALAHRARLPRTQNRSGPGPLRRTLLHRLASPRHPRHRSPPLHHPATARQPKSTWGSLSLYGILKELQRVLAAWLGYCPHCRQRAPT